MQRLSFVVHACASVHGHACTSYVNHARRLTCTALLVNLLRVRPPCIAVHCHAINGVREEEDGNAERRTRRQQGATPLVLVHTRATRTYEYIHERWTWRSELPPFHPASLSLISLHLFLPPSPRFFSPTRYTGGRNRIDPSFDRQLN